jgi:hypothetical protein
MRRMRFACWINRLPIHTQNTSYLLLYHTTNVRRTRLNITLYAHCLSSVFTPCLIMPTAQKSNYSVKKVLGALVSLTHCVNSMVQTPNYAHSICQSVHRHFKLSLLLITTKNSHCNFKLHCLCTRKIYMLLASHYS